MPGREHHPGYDRHTSLLRQWSSWPKTRGKSVSCSPATCGAPKGYAASPRAALHPMPPIACVVRMTRHRVLGTCGPSGRCGAERSERPISMLRMRVHRFAADLHGPSRPRRRRRTERFRHPAVRRRRRSGLRIRRTCRSAPGAVRGCGHAFWQCRPEPRFQSALPPLPCRIRVWKCR